MQHKEFKKLLSFIYLYQFNILKEICKKLNSTLRGKICLYCETTDRLKKEKKQSPSSDIYKVSENSIQPIPGPVFIY